MMQWLSTEIIVETTIVLTLIEQTATPIITIRHTGNSRVYHSHLS